MRWSIEKTSFRELPLIAIVAVGILCSAASAQVIRGTQIRFESEPPPTDEYGASVDQEPSGNGTGAIFAFTGSTFAAVEWTLDEESDWYLADSGDVFSATTIAANQFPIIFTTDDPRGPVAIPSGDFYLGMSTSNELDSESYGENGRNVFGWLELDNTGTELIPVDNAVAYGDQGIIVGTTTPVVPEPASAALLLAALPLLAIRCRRA
jgi:hypothetical protein